MIQTTNHIYIYICMICLKMIWKLPNPMVDHISRQTNPNSPSLRYTKPSPNSPGWTNQLVIPMQILIGWTILGGHPQNHDSNCFSWEPYRQENGIFRWIDPFKNAWHFRFRCFPRRLLGISSTSLVGLPTWYQVSGCFFWDVELFDSIRVPHNNPRNVRFPLKFGEITYMYIYKERDGYESRF